MKAYQTTCSIVLGIVIGQKRKVAFNCSANSHQLMIKLLSYFYDMVSKVRNPFVLAVNAVLCLKFSWWPYNQCQQRLLTSAEKSSELQNKVDKKCITLAKDYEEI